MSGLFQIQKAGDDRFVFRLLDADGQRLFTGEPCHSIDDARGAIAALKQRVTRFPNFERKKDRQNRMYFVVRTSEGHLLGSSERHTTIAALENGITAVNKSAPDAEVIDATGEMQN